MHRSGGVKHHQIATLSFGLRDCAKPFILCFQCEAHHPSVTFFGPQGGNHVRRFDELQNQAITRLGELLIRNSMRPIVTRGSHSDRAIAIRKLGLRNF